MKEKRVRAALMAFGVGTGSALYQVMRYGLSDVDWAKAVFIAAFSFLFFLLVPAKWLGSDKVAAKEGA